METGAMIEVGDKRQSVKLLTQQLEKAFERRSRMGRMDALDIESLPGDISTDTSSIYTDTTTDTECQINNNISVLTSSKDTPRVVHQCSKSLTELNNNSNSSTDEIITHKPPKYPSLPLGIKSRDQSITGGKDDPFSADFEDAIGDNIVEDTELEWDHSPDMDIITSDLDNGGMCFGGSVDHELDCLPLPPPPPSLLAEEVEGNTDDDEEPLPPPPSPPPDTEDDMYSLLVDSGIQPNSIEGIPQGDLIHVGCGSTSNSQNGYNSVVHFDNQKDKPEKTDLSAGNVSIESTRTVENTTNTNGVIPSLTSFENVVVCETPVINNPLLDSQMVEHQAPTSLDTSVSSTDGSGTHGDIEDSFACNNMATIVRPKSQSLKNRRPYYENMAENHQGGNAPLHLDTKRAASAYSDQLAIGSIPNGEVRLDQTPPPHSLYFKLPTRPHHYEEISCDAAPTSAVYFTQSSEEASLTHPEQVPSEINKKSPSTPGAKKVLFQLPTNGPNIDTEELTVDEHSERHSFHGLMHSTSSDAVLGSPSAKVKLTESRSKSPGLERSQKEIYRHSTPAVLHKVPPPVVNTTFSSSDSSASSVSRKGSMTGSLKHKTTAERKTSQASNNANHTLAGGRLLNKLKKCEVKKDSAVVKTGRQGENVPGSADSDDSYFTDSDFDDDYNDVYNIDEDGLSSTSDFTSYSDETVPRSPQAANQDMDSCYDVMLELLKTEKAYVDRLHFLCRVVLLNVKVLNNVQDVHILPPDAVTKIFSNIERIFSLHTSTVLPLVEERVTNWKFNPRVDDIMNEVLPHFMLYHEFVENFNTAMSSMTIWMEKCPVFQKLIQEVEKTPECRRMKVKQHFLEVVQRVPKYYDLLKSYTSHMTDRSMEKDSIKDVLSTLSDLVSELEREMGKTERMKKLCSVQQRLDSSALNIVSPLRELIKEGKIKSICAKTGKKLDRQLFLMDDMLLICTTSGLGGKFKLKFTLPVDRMQVHDSDNLVTPCTFYVQSKTRAIEFHCLSLEDKLCWVSTMQSAIDEFTKKRLLSQPVSVIQKTIPEEDIGKVQPRPESPQGQPLCYICKTSLKKVNNCKGCGMLVCQKCSSHKIKLDYDQCKLTRVCDECFVLVSNRDLLQSTANWDIPNVGPSDPCNIAGYLQLSFNKGHCWHKRWITLHSHGVMYSFKNFKDHQVVGSLTLKRFSFSQTSKGDDVHKPTTFKIYNARRVYFFQADNADAVCKWMDALADLCENKR